jgi:hypothetical protein
MPSSLYAHAETESRDLKPQKMPACFKDDQRYRMGDPLRDAYSLVTTGAPTSYTADVATYLFNRSTAASFLGSLARSGFCAIRCSSKHGACSAFTLRTPCELFCQWEDCSRAGQVSTDGTPSMSKMRFNWSSWKASRGSRSSCTCRDPRLTYHGTS